MAAAKKDPQKLVRAEENPMPSRNLSLAASYQLQQQRQPILRDDLTEFMKLKTFAFPVILNSMHFV